MRKTLTLMLILILATSNLLAQDRGIEISAYAGGLFSAGFQSYELIGIIPDAPSGKFWPARQASSGIFGLRGSYKLLPKLSIEGSVGYSPNGVNEDQFPLGPLPLSGGVLADPRIQPYLDLFPPPGDLAAPTSLFGVRIAGKDTLSYSGNVMFHPDSDSGWQPFLTGGLGVIQRRAEYRSAQGPIRAVTPPRGGLEFAPGPGGSTGGALPSPGSPQIICLACTIPLPSPGTTNFAVNFGAGVKRYLTNRWGVRLEFRDTISKYRDDTVNNPEVTFGVIFRH